ncbi:arrestin domain-containing protein 1a [Aplochiton taeniatus]
MSKTKGKLQEFDIVLTNNKDVYRPGESISGTIKMTALQPLLCKEIKVNCNGFSGVTSKINDTAWTDEEQYFNSTISVADQGTLKPGDHSFPFKFIIPDSAPTSFEGNYGNITYRVRAFIDTPRFSKDYKVEKPFYLLRLLNLNEVPDILGPRCSAVTQKFTYMLMKTGTVELKAQSELRGYTPGQIINITADINNDSGKNTGAVVASLIQRVTYQTKKPTIDLRTIAEVEGAGLKAGRQIEWKEKIIVPPLPQSHIAESGLINIEYYIQVRLKSPEVVLTLPIYIGNISLNSKACASTKPTASTPTPTTELSLTPTSTPTAEHLAIPRPTLKVSPKVAPRVAPRPAPRSRASSYTSPSAPPVEHFQGAIVAGRPASMALPTKSRSQLAGAGPQTPVSPLSFSYAPGLTFPQSHRQFVATDSSGPVAPLPVFSEGSAPPMPTTCALIPPPDYSATAHPHELPPSYRESCPPNT